MRVMIQPQKISISDQKNLAVWAAEFADELTVQNEGATVIGLVGPLGVGKTTFVQQLLAVYGVEDTVTSPTYTIETVYELPDSPFARCYHLDAYRLEDAEDLSALDFSHRLANKNNLILIEWAGVVGDALPDNTLHIEFSFKDNQDSEGREITLSYE